MPEITSPDGSISINVPYGSEWQQVVEYYPDLPIKFGCRNADCGVCAIRIQEGQEHLTKIGQKEKNTLARKGLSSDYRLACQCAINGDVCIEPNN